LNKTWVNVLLLQEAQFIGSKQVLKGNCIDQMMDKKCFERPETSKSALFCGVRTSPTDE